MQPLRVTLEFRPLVLSRISVRTGFAVIGGPSFSLVILSLVLTELLGLSPCPLCIFQRMLYMLLILPAVVVLIRPRSLYWSGGLALLIGLGGLVTAAYQSWMQAIPTESAACEYQDPNLLEQFVIWAGELAPSLFYAWGDCASTEWTFLGLSMANWSVAAFLGIAILLFALLRRGVR